MITPDDLILVELSQIVWCDRGLMFVCCTYKIDFSSRSFGFDQSERVAYVIYVYADGEYVLQGNLSNG